MAATLLSCSVRSAHPFSGEVRLGYRLVGLSAEALHRDVVTAVMLETMGQVMGGCTARSSVVRAFEIGVWGGRI